jgi:hypothetical protein
MSRVSLPRRSDLILSIQYSFLFRILSLLSNGKSLWGGLISLDLLMTYELSKIVHSD